MRKKLLSILTALVISICAHAQEEMVFIPQWTAQAQFAGYYVALEKGFYQRQGLKVHIEHPYASNSCIKLLKDGKCQLTTLPLMTALYHVNQGLHLINVQQTMQNTGLMFISHKPIRNIKSLNGLRIGHWKAGFFELAHLMTIENHLKIDWVPFIQNVNLFISGAIDATLAMSYNEFYQLQLSGIKMTNDHLLYLSETEYNLPEDGLYVTAEYYKQHKDAVDKFAKATREGWEWAAAHPDETIKIVMKMADDDDVMTNKLMQRLMLTDYLKRMTDKKSGKRTYRLAPSDLQRANRLLQGIAGETYPITFQQFTQP